MSTNDEAWNGWLVEQHVDADWYGGHGEVSLGPCPQAGPPRMISLEGSSHIIGRQSVSRNIVPDIDCSPDTGVSRRHAGMSLDDAGLDAASLPEGVSVDDVVVHQQDVQAVVNALWAAGAEAMTIQDQRVISTSAVRCVGNTLILRGRVYSPPFVVTAIGDQDALLAGLEKDPDVAVYREYVDRLGLGYHVERLQATFGPASGTIRPVHARLVSTGTTADPSTPETPRPSGRP